MRICLTTDWHIDAVTAGRPRLLEFPAYLSAIEAEGPFDFVFFLGDACDPGGRLGPRYCYELLKAARRLHDSAEVASVWIAGNHDVIETEEVYTSISPLRELAELAAGMHVAEVPTFFELAGLGVLCLPYVARAFERTDAYHAALGEAFGAAIEHRDEKRGPLGVIGHLSVPGAKLGSESKELARGRDIDFPAFDVARLNPIFVANGHYHEAQVVELGGTSIIIPGSPHRFTFGERRDRNKGFAILEF